MRASSMRAVRVAVEWDSAVVAERVLTAPGTVTVGDGPDADLLVPDAGESLPLVRAGSEGPALEIPPGWAGTVVLGGRPVRADEAGDEVRLGPDDSARLQPSADARVVVVVESVERFAPPVRSRRDWALAEALLLALVAHSTFLVVTALFARPVDDRPPRLEQRTARFILKKPEEPPKRDDLPLEAQKKVDERKKLLEQKLPAGAKDRRQELIEKVRKRGVLQALSTGATLQRLFTSSSDSQLESALSALQGDRITAGDGTGGGPGGGATRSGTQGGGGGTGAFGGASYEAGQVGGVAQAAGVKADIRGRGERRAKAELSYGSSDVEGSLTQKQIEAVIRAHASGIKYCYESELVKAPKLEGKVVAKWWIDSEGAVFKAVVDNSTAGSAALEECVLRQIRRWRFPKPPGSGTAVVRFPFIFKGAM